MKITAKREAHGKTSLYRVYADGSRTFITIERATERKKWGAPQQWDIMLESDDDVPRYLFYAKGHADALGVLQAVANELTRGAR